MEAEMMTGGKSGYVNREFTIGNVNAKQLSKYMDPPAINQR